jgi:hypothetical protein
VSGLVRNVEGYNRYHYNSAEVLFANGRVAGDFVRGVCNLICSFAAVDRAGVHRLDDESKEGGSSVDIRWKSASPFQPRSSKLAVTSSQQQTSFLVPPLHPKQADATKPSGGSARQRSARCAPNLGTTMKPLG